MTEIAKHLAKEGYILRSGAADGADTAFEEGAGDQKEILIPWRNYNNRKDIEYKFLYAAAVSSVKMFHPAFDVLSQGAIKLHARNFMILFGADPKAPAPVDFVICWTPGGSLRGGTAQALRIALHNDMIIYNLGKKDDLEYWKERIGSKE